MTCMIESEGTAIMAALEKSLESFGEHSKRVLLFHMAERFGIGDSCAITFEQVQRSIEELLGTAAPLVMEPVRKELEAMAGRTEA